MACIFKCKLYMLQGQDDDELPILLPPDTEHEEHQGIHSTIQHNSKKGIINAAKMQSCLMQDLKFSCSFSFAFLLNSIFS